jgi:Zn finger protein HypA/HybF involved in hydrogenase expression
MKKDELKCKYCGNDMFLDDGKDYNFKGCYDNYYFCYKCGASAVEMVRDGKRVNIEWVENTEEEY